MQNDQSGARKQHKKARGEVLSAHEAAAFNRGQEFKRCVRAAAALRGIFDDTTLATKTKIARGSVRDWWEGAKPAAGTIPRLAEATGLPADELLRFLYEGGPLPTLPTMDDPGAIEAEAEALRRSRFGSLSGLQPRDRRRPSRESR